MRIALPQQVLDGTCSIIAPIGGVDTTIGKAHGRVAGDADELQLAALELSSTALSNLGSITAMRYAWAAAIASDSAWVTAAVAATTTAALDGKYGITGTRVRTQTRAASSTTADVASFGSGYTTSYWDVRLGDASGPSGSAIGRLIRSWDNTHKVLIDQWVLSEVDYVAPNAGGNQLHLTKLSSANLQLDFVAVGEDVLHLHEAYALRDKA